MKTKITLGIAGLLLGLVFGAGVLTASAAEPGTVPVSGEMKQVDAATLKNSLNTLQGLLDQLSNDIKNGRITATDAAVINVTLATTQKNLLTVNNTLALLYPPTQNFAKSEISPAPTSGAENELNTGLNIEPSQNVSAETAPLESNSGQASLSSFLTSKTTVGIVLVVVLVAVVVFVSRRKPKAETQTQTV